MVCLQFEKDQLEHDSEANLNALDSTGAGLADMAHQTAPFTKLEAELGALVASALLAISADSTAHPVLGTFVLANKLRAALAALNAVGTAVILADAASQRTFLTDVVSAHSGQQVRVGTAGETSLCATFDARQRVQLACEMIRSAVLAALYWVALLFAELAKPVAKAVHRHQPPLKQLRIRESVCKPNDWGAARRGNVQLHCRL